MPAESRQETTQASPTPKRPPWTVGLRTRPKCALPKDRRSVWPRDSTSVHIVPPLDGQSRVRLLNPVAPGFGYYQKRDCPLPPTFVYIALRDGAPIA